MSCDGKMDIFKCLLCKSFQSLSLRLLLNHYRCVHANEPSFTVKCNVNNCPAEFSLYNSLYRHVTRKHKEIYDKFTGKNISLNGAENGQNETFEENSHVLEERIEYGVHGGDDELSEEHSSEDSNFENVFTREANVQTPDDEVSKNSFEIYIQEHSKSIIT